MQTFMGAELARRLERCEGAVNASFVETHAQQEPGAGAGWIESAGTYAMFDGVGSPMTQTFGLGLFGPPELERLEAFFGERGAPTDHELSPLAGVAVSAALVARGYAPIEHSTVLIRELGLVSPPPDERVHVARPEQREAWVEASIRGWSSEPGVATIIGPVARLAFSNPRVVSVHLEHEGQIVATGSMGVHEGVALLAGASTAPEHRGRGAQAALLAARLAMARERGCDVAMMVTEPGSGSQRNAERSGFRVAYTRTKWRRALV